MLFTFHNVSIKSEELTEVTLTYWPLHSTMYLLNQSAGAALSDAAITFTFHNVSIKSTDGRRRIRKRTATLHSTMYLLNLSDRF